MTLTLDESFLTAVMQRALADAPATNVPGVAVPKTQVRAELKGDLIVVPRGTPHRRSTADKDFTMLLIKLYTGGRPAPARSPAAKP